MPEDSRRTASVVDERPPRPIRATPCITVFFSTDQPRAAASRHSLSKIDEVVLARGAEAAQVRGAVSGVRRLMLRLPDLGVSSRHARVIRTNEGWKLEDLESKNGTRCNGERVRTAVLRDGDIIDVGRTFL